MNNKPSDRYAARQSRKNLPDSDANHAPIYAESEHRETASPSIKSPSATERHGISDEISQDEVKYCLDVMLKNPTAFIIHIRDREELDRSNAVMMLHMIAKRVETPAGADPDQADTLRRGPSTDTLVALSTVTNKIDFFITSVVNQWNHFQDFQNNAQDGICDTGVALCNELDEVQRKVSLETLNPVSRD